MQQEQTCCCLPKSACVLACCLCRCGCCCCCLLLPGRVSQRWLRQPCDCEVFDEKLPDGREPRVACMFRCKPLAQQLITSISNSCWQRQIIRHANEHGVISACAKMCRGQHLTAILLVLIQHLQPLVCFAHQVPERLSAVRGACINQDHLNNQQTFLAHPAARGSQLSSSSVLPAKEVAKGEAMLRHGGQPSQSMLPVAAQFTTSYLRTANGKCSARSRKDIRAQAFPRNEDRPLRSATRALKA